MRKIIIKIPNIKNAVSFLRIIDSNG